MADDPDPAKLEKAFNSAEDAARAVAAGDDQTAVKKAGEIGEALK